MNKNLIWLLVIITFTGCGSSDTSVKKIDIASYLPTTSMSKEYIRHLAKLKIC